MCPPLWVMAGSVCGMPHQKGMPQHLNVPFVANELFRHSECQST